MPAGVVPTLLAARARHVGRRWLIVIAGLALAALVPVLTQAVSSVTAAAALRQGLADLPPGERSVTVTYGSILDPAQRQRVDGLVSTALPRVAAAPIRRQLLFRRLADGTGGALVLAAADRLDAEVRVVSGRLPASCAPTRCEVVVLDLPGVPAVAPPDSLGLVVVGHAVRTDPLLLSGTFDPGADAGILLADGVGPAGALAALSSFERSYGWVAPLDVDRVRAVGVTAWIDQGARVAQDLGRSESGLAVTAPEDALRREDQRATVSAQRFSLLGGANAVLLLGTAVVGGAALRRDHEAFLGALRRRGARRRQLGWLVLGEVSAAAVTAALAGIVLGAVAGAVLAARAGLPVATTVGSAVASAGVAVLALTVAGAGLLALTLTVRPGPDGTAHGAWRAVDGASAACLAGIALLVSRGGISASTGTAGGTGDPLLPLLPGLVLVAAGLLAARVWPGLVRLAQGAVPRRSIAARLGLTAAAGRPLRPAATAALLTAALAAAVFAGSYRATLDRGASDQAAFAVPLDALVQIGRSQTRPQDAVPPATLLAAAGGAADGVVPVVRRTATVKISAEQGAAVQLVGVAAPVLPRIARWQTVTGDGDPAAAAARLGVPALAPGLLLPPGAQLRIATTGAAVTLAVTAFVRSDDGRERSVELAVDRPPSGPAGLVGALPELRRADGSAAMLALVALSLHQPLDAADRRQHRIGEGSNAAASPSGTILLGSVEVDGIAARRPAGGAGPWQGWAPGAGAGSGLVVAADGGSARVDYRIDTGSLVLQGRPDGPGSATALPVLTDPQTADQAAASGGVLTLDLDASPVLVRVVGRLDHFPTTAGRFAVADREAVARLADIGTPGTGQATQLWLAAAPSGAGALAAALAGPAFQGVEVTRRAQVEAGLRADPVARAASGLLAVGAGLVLLVAGASLVLLVVTERSDDAASTYAWEADGVAPSTLRAALWWRAIAVAAPAVPAGVAVGALLSQATARLVAVTATATAAVPALVPGLGIGAGVLVVLVALGAALGVAGLVASRSLREALPTRVLGVPR